MSQRDYPRLASALSPALGAALQALQPGRTVTLDAAQATTALDRLRRASKHFSAIFPALEKMAEANPIWPAQISLFSRQAETAMAELIDAARQCQAINPQLADVARDALIIHAHYLADLIVVLADPLGALGEYSAVAQGDNQYVVTLNSAINIPDSLDELAHWQAGRFACNEARIRQALRLAQSTTTAPPVVARQASAPVRPAKKSSSGWSAFALGGLLGLLIGGNDD